MEGYQPEEYQMEEYQMEGLFVDTSEFVLFYEHYALSQV